MILKNGSHTIEQASARAFKSLIWSGMPAQL